MKDSATEWAIECADRLVLFLHNNGQDAFRNISEAKDWSLKQLRKYGVRQDLLEFSYDRAIRDAERPISRLGRISGKLSPMKSSDDSRKAWSRFKQWDNAR